MNVIMATVGSAGDLHPFVAIALRLRERGHSVMFVTNPHFAPLLERLGFPFLPVGTAEQFDEATAHPALWSQFRSFRVLSEIIRHSTPAMFRHLERQAEQSGCLLVAHPLAFGARIANEALGLPLVTLHLSPSTLWSVENPPVPSRWVGPLSHWPRAARRFVVALGDRFADAVLAPDLDRFRAELGLAPVRHVGRSWWHSPQRVIGLFPDWFAEPQPDWPPQTALTGFPLYDERGVSPLPAHLEAFLAGAEDAGNPPVVFVPGSSNRQAGRFFSAAAEACQRLKTRGLFLTRYPEQLPAPLPRLVCHAGYAPLSAVLPRCAALVHHGGIGTAGQALAAGIPQLVMPMTFDQPDNAIRLKRLGVARILTPRRFRAPQVERHLEALVGSGQARNRAAVIASRFAGIDPVSKTCDLIERASPTGTD